MTTGIVWFRTDLRVADHAPLARLAASCRALLPVYCVDPGEFMPTRWGFGRTGGNRARFLFATVAALRDQLRQRGSDLVVRVGRARDILPEIAQQSGAKLLAYHQEAAIDERVEEQAIVAAAAQCGMTAIALWEHTLVPIESLPFAVDALPTTFTPFRKAVESRISIPSAKPVPPKLPPLPQGIEPGSVPTLAELGVESPATDPRTLFHFVGGEAGGHERMCDYVWRRDRLRVYKETRNGMLQPDDVSRLSPWLALGALSPRQVHDEIIRYEVERVQNQSTYWLKFELLWRDYFRFVALRAGSSLFQRWGPMRRNKRWRWDEALFRAWCRGETGYPLVDANMQELAATGYMSNRGRQIVASFLLNDLEIDWRAGAAWFEAMLLDYDPCSNYGNWAYAAGVGNDPRPARYFALSKQAKNYDPDGAYVKHWLPALRDLPAAEAHAPWLAQVPVAYPPRITALRAKPAGKTSAPSRWPAQLDLLASSSSRSP